MFVHILKYLKAHQKLFSVVQMYVLDFQLFSWCLKLCSDIHVVISPIWVSSNRLNFHSVSFDNDSVVMKYVDFELTMNIGNTCMYHLHVTVYFVVFLHNCCRLILKAQTMFVRMEQLGTFRLRNLWKMKRTESKRKKKRKSKTIPWRYNTAALKCGVPHS